MDFIKLVKKYSTLLIIKNFSYDELYNKKNKLINPKNDLETGLN